jgi:signal transduction histidine kinase
VSSPDRAARSPRWWRAAGLSTRLLAAQVLVVLAAQITAWVVASLVGPPLFHQHLDRAGVRAEPETLAHVEEAFRSANALSLTVALLAAVGAAVIGSYTVARRIGRPVTDVADAATSVAAGDYATVVPPPGIGPEFDALARAFNEMAARLGSVEATRRRLLADLAHEMRTPLATLDGYLEALEDGVATLDPAVTDLLRDQTRRLTRLAEDVAAVSRAEEGQVTLSVRPVPPAALVEAAVGAAAAPYAERGLRLETLVEPGLPHVVVDAERIGQVLGNLLDNALRYTPAGGCVTVSARRAERAVSAGPRDQAGMVELTVTDTGAGIPAEHLPHVFERFYRADPARDRAGAGSGIGLAISKALVEAHGGRIAAASAGPGRGTTVTVRLPAGPRGG